MKHTFVENTPYDFEFYAVKTGFLKDEDPIIYLVQNKTTGIVEFSHEVLPFALEWVTHFTKRLEAIIKGKPLDEEDEVAGIVRSVN